MPNDGLHESCRSAATATSYIFKGSLIWCSQTDPNFASSRANCGIGAVVSLGGRAYQEIVSDTLERLDHHDARGAEESTGDGVGIMSKYQGAHAAGQRRRDTGLAYAFAEGATLAGLGLYQKSSA